MKREGAGSSVTNRGEERKKEKEKKKVRGCGLREIEGERKEKEKKKKERMREIMLFLPSQPCSDTWQGTSPFIIIFFKAPSFYKSLQDPTNLKILSFDN
jgi:hypothetical protein